MTNVKTIKKSALSPTVLILGGAGFIGSHLAETFLSKGARVVVLDNFSTGKDIFVHSLRKESNFILIDGDLNKGIPDNIESVDYIIHLAGVETYLREEDNVDLNTLLTNAIGTRNALEFAKKASAKFLLVSSTNVYKGVISPVSLDNYYGEDSVEERMFTLAEAKRYAEALVWEYYKKFELDVRIARLPEVYGPRMSLDASANLGKLLKNLLDNKPLSVYGDGVEKEYYLYISDVVAALIKALFNEGTSGSIYTFVSKEAQTYLETTYLLKNLANTQAKVVFKPKTGVALFSNPIVPDTSNVRDLKWEPQVSFKEGISKTLDWFGYEVNGHSFKVNKLIENKEKSKVLSENSPTENNQETVSSLIDIPSPVEALSVSENEVEKPLVVTNVNGPSFFQSLSRKIKSIKLAIKVKTSFSKTPEIQPSPLGHKVKLFVAYLMLIALAVFVFVGVPILQTYINAAQGRDSLEQAISKLSVFETVQAQKYANEAFRSFHKAEQSFERIRWLFNLFGEEDSFKDVQRLFNAASFASKATFYMSQGVAPMVDFWASIGIENDTLFDFDAFGASKLDFAESLNNANFALSEIERIQNQKLLDMLPEKTNNLENVVAYMEFLLVMTDEMPALVGADGSAKYLVLFQNSNEIRPTGGFIGSYSIIEFKNGKLEEILIDDIYNPDGQIMLREIQVTPPQPISEYLGEDILYIRNANWSPDFQVSSNQIQDLFFRLDGHTFDGVFALDLAFVEKLLNALGPVYLTAFNEEISSSNLYERAQFHAEFNYQDGSEQKKTFLTLLGSKLLERVFSLENEQMFGVGQAVYQSLQNKHFLVDLSGFPVIDQFLTENKWNGRVVDNNGDYLFVVNSNLGGTKANYYVENTMDYTVATMTRDGLLRSRLSLDYIHTGLDSSWPGGPYTNYVRVYTPRGSRLTGATLRYNGATSENIFDEVTTSFDLNKNVFEVGFILQPKEDVSLILEYDLPERLSITREAPSYSLYWQKQPGTVADPIKFRFNSPFGLTANGSGTFETTNTLLSDLEFMLDLVPTN